jgi:hypothetical protein
MCYGENSMVKCFETLADNVFRYNYSMMQIKKKLNDGKILGYPRSTPLSDILTILGIICACKVFLDCFHN